MIKPERDLKIGDVVRARQFEADRLFVVCSLPTKELRFIDLFDVSENKFISECLDAQDLKIMHNKVACAPVMYNSCRNNNGLCFIISQEYFKTKEEAFSFILANGDEPFKMRWPATNISWIIDQLY